MKKIDSLVFSAALLLFGIVGFFPGSRVVAQMTAWCPGGSSLLCGTTTQRTCTAVDPRTAQCSAWKEEALYDYYPSNSGGDSGGDGCGDGRLECLE
jgi:hypothetical protein